MSEHPRRQGRSKWNPLNITLAVFVGLFLLLLLSPVLQDALMYPGRQESRRINYCQSNMRQLGLALDQYTQDADGMLPPATESNGLKWREAIYPFVKSTGVYQCPDDSRRGDFTPDNLPRSYAANHLGADSRGRERGAFAAVGEAPVMLTQFSQPSKTIFLCDTQASDASEWNMVSPAFLPSTGRELFVHVPGHAFYEHPGGALTCLFADGHVKRLKPMATLTPVNLWTRDNARFTGQDLQNARAVLTHAEDE